MATTWEGHWMSEVFKKLNLKDQSEKRVYLQEMTMAKSQNAKKDVKKKSVKTLKEKRHDKKAKKEKK